MVFANIAKTYGARAVIRDLSLEISSAKITAVAGVNGSGKSTLMRIAAGFVTQTSGSVHLVDGKQEKRLDELGAVQRVKSGIAYLPQSRRILLGMSSLDNLRLVAKGRDIYATLGELRLLHLLDIAPNAMKAPDLVSLLLARTYLLKPKFALVDEPFASLDDVATERCAFLIRRMRDEGIGIVLTDHNPRALLHLAEKIHIMREGELEFSGSPDEVRASPKARELYFRVV